MVVLGATLIAGTWTGARAEGLRAPQNVNAEPGNKQSAELATRSAMAQMKGNAPVAVTLANEGIRADPDDPWPYYNKGMALASLGQVNAAVAALLESEKRFAANDLWGRSVAIYGRAHALSQVGRCAEARQAFEQYAALVEPHDAEDARMARSYATHCHPAPIGPAASDTPPPATTPPPAPRASAPALPPLPQAQPLGVPAQ
jgi:tetratricopeptide (TPR) repeat protein